MQESEVLLYSIMAAMTAAALAFIIPSLWRKRAEAGIEDEVHRKELSAALKSELVRLDEDLAAGRINAVLHEELLADLKRRALEESGAELMRYERDDDKKRAVRVTAAFNIVVLLSAALYWALGAPEVMRLYKHQQVLEGRAAVEDIEIYLESNAGDARAWVLLAHRFVDEGRFDKAFEAYVRAAGASPEAASDAGIMLEAAAAGLAAGNPENLSQARRLLEKVVAVQPENLQAVELLSITAMALGDLDLELEMNRILLEKMDPASHEYKRMKERTRRLRTMIEAQEKAADSTAK